VTTAELASVGRAASHPMVLGDSLALRAVDTSGVEVADQPLKTGGVVWKVVIELIEGVAGLRCGASLRAVSVALAHNLNILQTSTCVKGIITMSEIHAQFVAVPKPGASSSVMLGFRAWNCGLISTSRRKPHTRLDG